MNDNLTAVIQSCAHFVGQLRFMIVIIINAVLKVLYKQSFYYYQPLFVLVTIFLDTHVCMRMLLTSILYLSKEIKYV